MTCADEAARYAQVWLLAERPALGQKQTYVSWATNAIGEATWAEKSLKSRLKTEQKWSGVMTAAELPEVPGRKNGTSEYNSTSPASKNFGYK